ncbi:hypothetical protein Q5530_28655 [Saccharothrix sp. BKS2]|uniref:hypothetical protein n=1 Tax=Saccharothrix sp. BKS2 TaxID=3064400 RepID=UPI0039E78CDC
MTVLLVVEALITLLPVVRGLLFEGPSGDVLAAQRAEVVLREPDVPIGQPPGLRQGVLLATTALMLVMAMSALASVWSRPRSRTWLVMFAGTHAAAAGLGWVHSLPLLTLLATVSAVAVPLVALAPWRQQQ